MAQIAKLSPAIASAINLARQHADDESRKALKREMFAAAKAQFGIPADIKLKCDTSNPDNPDYLVLKASATNETFQLGDDGLWVNAVRQQAAPVVRPTRWFKVSSDDLVEAAKDAVLSDGADWDDDSHNSMAATADDVVPGLKKGNDGTFYVEMTEDELV